MAYFMDSLETSNCEHEEIVANLKASYMRLAGTEFQTVPFVPPVCSEEASTTGYICDKLMAKGTYLRKIIKELKNAIKVIVLSRAMPDTMPFMTSKEYVEHVVHLATLSLKERL